MKTYLLKDFIFFKRNILIYLILQIIIFVIYAICLHEEEETQKQYILSGLLIFHLLIPLLELNVTLQYDDKDGFLNIVLTSPINCKKYVYAKYVFFFIFYAFFSVLITLEIFILQVFLHLELNYMLLFGFFAGASLLTFYFASAGISSFTKKGLISSPVYAIMILLITFSVSFLLGFGSGLAGAKGTVVTTAIVSITFVFLIVRNFIKSLKNIKKREL